VTRQLRRARERLLDQLDARLCTQVVDALDFDRLAAIERTFVAELERLIDVGQLPAPPDHRTVEVRAAAMVANALLTVIDQRHAARTRGPVDEVDCELCRMAGSSGLPS